MRELMDKIMEKISGIIVMFRKVCKLIPKSRTEV